MDQAQLARLVYGYVKLSAADRRSVAVRCTPFRVVSVVLVVFCWLFFVVSIELLFFVVCFDLLRDRNVLGRLWLHLIRGSRLASLSAIASMSL